MVEPLVADRCRLIFPECHESSRKSSPILKILASLHLQPSVKELSTALQANIAALILVMITVSPNLLSAEFSELARRGIDLYRPALLLDDDVVTNGQA
jgi:hypothetical protein